MGPTTYRVENQRRRSVFETRQTVVREHAPFATRRTALRPEAIEAADAATTAEPDECGIAVALWLGIIEYGGARSRGEARREWR